MSWHVIVMNFDGHPPPDLERVAKEWRPPAIGDAARVRAWISETLDVDWSDAARGELQTDDFVIELDVPATPGQVVRSIGIRVVGAGNPVPTLARMCLVHGWAAYDVSAGDFIDFDEERARGWEGYCRLAHGKGGAA